MLVEHRVDLDRRGVQPGLVRERGEPDVGLMRVRGDVGDLADRVRDPAHLGHAPGREHLAVLLELQARDHAEQVGVAGPLPVTVGRALDVGDAGLHRGQRVRHGAGGVVMAVDAQPRPARRGDRRDHVAEFGGQHAPVGVAQRDHLGAGLGGHPDHLQRVAGVGAVAVEEVLGVEEHPLALGRQVPHRVGDHGEVLFQGGPQRRGDVPVVALGDQRHDRGAGLTQRCHLRVVGGHRTRARGSSRRPPGWRR